jgi:cbb3-type cytochrome oxidase subunit 3
VSARSCYLPWGRAPDPTYRIWKLPERKELMQRLLQWLSDYGWFIAIPLGFIVIVFYVFRPGAKKRYQEDGRIPLEDKNPKHD